MYGVIWYILEIKPQEIKIAQNSTSDTGSVIYC